MGVCTAKESACALTNQLNTDVRVEKRAAMLVAGIYIKRKRGDDGAGRLMAATASTRTGY